LFALGLRPCRGGGRQRVFGVDARGLLGQRVFLGAHARPFGVGQLGSFLQAPVGQARGLALQFQLRFQRGARRVLGGILGGARLGGGQDARLGFAPRSGSRGSRLFQALAVHGGVAQFLFGLQAQAQRLRGGALGLDLGQRDGFAFLLDVRQGARFFQRTRFGG